MNADEEIAQLQRDWAEAVQRRDMAALEQLLGEEFTLTTGRKGAEMRRRQEWLDITRESYEVDQWAYDEMDVRAYGDARQSAALVAAALQTQLTPYEFRHGLGQSDLIGLDTCVAIMKVLQNGLGDDKYAPAPLLEKYVEQGKLGRKSKEGFYIY